MKKRFLRIFLAVLSVALILSSLTFVIFAAEGDTEGSTHSDYTPTTMWSTDFKSVIGAAGANTAKESVLVTEPVSDNTYMLLRPNYNGKVSETRIDIGLSSRKQGDARLINLKSFKNSSGTELTYACDKKYVIYDFDLGTETDLTDGAIFQIIARKISSNTATALSTQSMAGTIDFHIADDETTGNLLIGSDGTAQSYIDTGVSIDNAFAHISIVLDLTEVISTNDPSKATAHVYVNGKSIGISKTGFASNANYFDMARLTMTGVTAKVTDSYALDNYASRSFGTDYNGNLASILADPERSLSDFDCGVYNSNYKMPTMRPLAKVGNKEINSNVKLASYLISGDFVRFMRPANYCIAPSVEGVTSYYPTADTLYATFDESGKNIASFTASTAYSTDINKAAIVEIYKDITVIAKGTNYAANTTVYVNGHTVYFDAKNSTTHFIYAQNNKTVSYVGPGKIWADAYTNTSGSGRCFIYTHQGETNAKVNMTNLTLSGVNEMLWLRSGVTTLDGCDISWSKQISSFALMYGNLNGSTTDTSAKLNMTDSTVTFTGADAWNNYFITATTGRFNSNKDYLRDNNCVINIEGSTLNLAGANVIHTNVSTSLADDPASCKPTLNMTATTVTGCRRFAPVNTNNAIVPTFNIVNSTIATPTMGQFVQDGIAGTSPVINFENTLLGTDPATITGKIVYADNNKVIATSSTSHPYIVTNPDVNANVTLNSDFTFNLFVPKESFVSASADGIALPPITEIEAGGRTYVVLAYTGIAPAEAGVSATADITMTNGKVVYTASYNFSITKYVGLVCENAKAGYSDSVRAVPLMAAIVNYIDNAYTYFEKTEGIDEVSELKALLAEEISALGAASIGTAYNTTSSLSDYFTEAYMVINSVPKIRFSLKSDASGAVTINGKVYEISGGKYNGNTYIEIDVRAVNVKSTVIMSADGKTAKYNIADYYNYLKSVGETKACTLLDSLFIYCTEARNYVMHDYDSTLYEKDSTHHWHVCNDSSCGAVLNKTAHEFGEDGKCVCGYVYGDGESEGSFLSGFGIEETVQANVEGIKYARLLDNSTVSYSFTEEETAKVERGDVLLFSFLVRGSGACTPITLNVDLGTVINDQSGTSAMTYYAPVQWTRIYMPIKNNEMRGVAVTTSGAVEIAEARYENCGNVSVDSLTLKSGMWMVDDFDTYELQASDTATYLNGTYQLKSTIAIQPSSDGKYIYTIGYNASGTFAISDAKTGALIGYIEGIGSEPRQLEIANLTVEGEEREYAIITMRAFGACILDITDKSAPTIASTYNTVELATGLEVSGSWAFITNRYHGVEVVDISNPKKPVQKANIYTGGEVQSCVVYDNILYCGVWGECGVYMYDLSELETTSELTRIGRVICNGKGDGLTVTKINGRTYIFAATGQHTYGAATTSKAQNLAFGQGNGLDIFDVTDPASPIWISTSKIDGRYYYTGNDFWEAEVSEADGRYYAYLVNTYNGVYVYDVTDLHAPVRLAHIKSTAAPTSGTLLKHDTRTILTAWDQAKEARNPIGSIVVNDGILYLAVIGTHSQILRSSELFYNSYENDTHAADLTIGDVYGNLDTKLDEGYYTLWQENEGQVLSVSRYGKFIYVAAGSDGILVFTRDGEAGELILTHRYPARVVSETNARIGFASSIEVRGNVLYSAEDARGFRAYEIDPTDGSLEEINGWYWCVSGYAVNQVRISPSGGYAIVQINSDRIAAIELLDNGGTKTVGTVTVKMLPGGHLYHRNLSDVINDRYIIAWNHVGYTYWVDFAPENGTDSPPVFINVQCDTMRTMINGIASYNGAALCITGSTSYRLFTDTTTYTGVGYAGGVKISGKPTVCGDYLVVTRHDNGMIYIIDLTTNTLIHTIDTVGNPDIAYYDETANTVYIPLGNQGLLAIDLSAFDTANQ